MGVVDITPGGHICHNVICHTFAKGSLGWQKASWSGGGPSGRQLPAARNVLTAAAGHIGSQQQCGVHVLLSSAQMQVADMSVADEGVFGTMDQAIGYVARASVESAAAGRGSA